jgi:hypothetical protein
VKVEIPRDFDRALPGNKNMSTIPYVPVPFQAGQVNLYIIAFVFDPLNSSPLSSQLSNMFIRTISNMETIEESDLDDLERNVSAQIGTNL